MTITALIGSCFFLFQCKTDQDKWQYQFSDIGSLSSPRCVDLNGDGVKDIVMGVGKEEFEEADTAIVAIDGNSGTVLWAISAKDQIFGSPVFHDITNDNVPDVFINGRTAQLLAIDGAKGKIIWDFNEQNTQSGPWFNFYNPQLIINEKPILLVANGGDVTVKPYDADRPAGKLLLVDAFSGKVIAQDTMPYGGETYFSAVIQKKNNQEIIIFGSGGETIGGHLFALPLQDLFNGSIQRAIILAEDSLKGFIAPPVLTDITGDGIEDIVANAVNGRLLAIDGNTYEMIWEVSEPGYEVYAAPSPGKFNDDDIPDFFVNFSEGIWPDVIRCKQLAIDGKDGTILFADSLGFFQMASPVSADLNQDGFDEVVLSVNYEYQENAKSGITLPPQVHNQLLYFDIKSKTSEQLVDGVAGANMAITPTLVDLDNDNNLDIIYGSHANKYSFTDFKNLAIRRIELDVPVPARYWGGYMGNEFNARY